MTHSDRAGNQQQTSSIHVETAIVLVVDDDLGMRQILRKLVEQEGFQVIEATNGREALELYNRHVPDLVLLDAMMPVMDGFTCCRLLCSTDQAHLVPVLIVTTLDDAGSVTRAFEAGAIDYITKPINRAVFRQRVHRLMQQSRLMQQVQQMNEALNNYAQTLNVTIRERTAQLQRSLEFESTLKQITDRVRDSLDENQILQTVVQELSWALGLGCCNAAIYDTQQRISQVQYEYTASIPGYQYRMIQMDDYPEIYQQLLQNRPVQFCSLVAQSWRGQVALFAFPITTENTTGDLWLISHADRILDDLELRLVQQVVNQCAIALRQARLYQAAQTQVQKLEQLNQLKDDFLSTVSHELRTPIASMKMVIKLLTTLAEQGRDLVEELAKAPNPNNKIAQYLAVLQEECDRELSLVEDLLSLQHLDAGTYSDQITTIHLQDWIPHIIEPFETQVQNQQQTLQIDLAPNLPTIMADPLILNRIVTELLANACKYTPLGETISISVQMILNESIPDTRQDLSNNRPLLEVIVCNSGVEIAPEELSRIFDKFYRIPNHDPWQYGGTGLGLALVKKLLEQMDGTIRVRSSDHLTQFIVQFPLSIA